MKNGTDIAIAVIKKDVEYIKGQVSTINLKLDTGYVTKAEFDVIKKITYGAVGIMLAAVLYGILRLVVA